jgi:glycosyltransferase involved in cell wall biosynthesis
MPRVSVIMNIRNGAEFLRQAVESVLSQTFADWELIAWDDCSTDASASIISKYADLRIKYFLSAEDVSLGQARDRAIREARGEWLAFLDQDDVWVPAKLEKQMALVSSETGIIYGRTLVFYPDGRRTDYDVSHEFTLLPQGDIFTQLFTEACFIAMSSAVLRRSAVADIGGIPETINLVPDYYLYAGIARRYKARAVQEVVCLYRMHASNLSRRRDSRLYLEPLSVVNQWAAALPSELVAYRRKSYSTALALNELAHPATFPAGLRRLLGEGSVSWLLQRPFVHLYRSLRRKLRRPYWKQFTSDFL